MTTQKFRIPVGVTHVTGQSYGLCTTWIFKKHWAPDSANMVFFSHPVTTFRFQYNSAFVLIDHVYLFGILS